jgi:hypothetical protein
MNERIKELSLQAMSLVMNGKDPDGDVKRMYIPKCFADKFAELVRADEREACAKLCEEISDSAHALWKVDADPTEQGRDIGAEHCAQAIRARGEK